MVASDGFMKSPPDSFDRIGFRRAGRQKMQFHAMSPALQILAHGAAIVKLGVVADHGVRSVNTIFRPMIASQGFIPPKSNRYFTGSGQCPPLMGLFIRCNVYLDI